MDGGPTSAAYDLGQRMRWARLRAGWRLVDLEERTGISTSTLSRMELGRGGPTPLDTWISVGEALGIDLFGTGDDETASMVASLELLLKQGAWTLTDRRGGFVWFDRPPRPNPWLPRSVRPAERIVVHVVPLLTDARAAFDRLREAVTRTRSDAVPGTGVGGVLVVWRTMNNLRRAPRTERHRSHPLWMSALRSPDGRLPVSLGLVWLATRATHLQGVA